MTVPVTDHSHQAILVAIRRFRAPSVARPQQCQLEMPVEAFQAFLREAPNDMPSYPASVLSDKDAADMLAFLRSLPGRRPVGDFPLLNR